MIRLDSALRSGQQNWAAFDRFDDQHEQARYRYLLGRRWSEELPLATFIMLNPSTADALQDDATIRKCCGFARRWQLGGIRVVNLFAVRATNPRKIRVVPDPVGEENGVALASAFQERGLVVCAWGAFAHPLVDKQVASVLALAAAAGVGLLCLRVTSKGCPEHPLYVPWETELKPWPLPVTT